MTAAKATRVAKDGATTPAPFNYGFLDESGAGAGPFDPIHAMVDSTGALINPATKEGVAAVATAIAGLHQAGDTQTVAGTVAVSNFPATQPISATALPLPSGAASAAGLTALGADGGLASVGARADAPAANPSATASLIAKISGLWAALLGTPPGTADTKALTVQGNPSGLALPVSATALPLPAGASTAALQGTANTALSAIQASVAGTLAVSAGALPLPAGAATDATLQAIKSALLAQVDFANLIVQDSTNAFFVRRESVNEGSGVVTVSFTTLAGAAATPTGAISPATGGGNTRVIETALFDATASGTGYASGDVIARVLVYDTAANTIVASYWHDVTTGAAIASAPVAGNLLEQARNLAAGASTAALQTANTAAVSALGADGGLATIGTKSDVAPANPTASGTVVGVLKGVWATLVARLPLDANGNLKFAMFDVNGANVTYGGTTVVQGVAGGLAVDTVVKGTAVDRGGYTEGGATAAITAAAGTGYVPGATITLAGGTLAPGGSAAQLTVATTLVGSATVANGGSGGTTGTQTVTGTTGTGTKFTALVTVASGAITAVNSISLGGSYTVNPTALTAEPVTGGGLTGATLSIVMGVATTTVSTPGAYTAVPANPAVQSSTSGSGTGANFNVTFAPISFQLMPSNASRRGYELQNQDTYGTLYYSGIATAVVGPSSKRLSPGDEFDSNPQHIGTGAMSAIGTAIGMPFFAREF